MRWLKLGVKFDEVEASFSEESLKKKSALPIIDDTGFGWISVDNTRYNHDIIIFTDGKIRNRYQDFKGDSHTLSREEAEKVIGKGAETLVVGTGQSGVLSIPEETKQFLSKLKIKLIAEQIPKAIKTYNTITGKKCALFHTTC